MVFSSPIFLYAFLPLLLAAYYIIRNDTYRRAVLVLFSLVFYACGEPKNVLLMIALVAADYLFGLLVGNENAKPGVRRLFLVLAAVLNLGVLGFFKYLGFFCSNLNSVFGPGIAVPDVALPIGISFFTFQALSYVIDVYRGDAEPQRSFFSLLLYVSFFPQLIAGPIVRYKDIADQLSDRTVDIAKINDGLYRFAVGLGKKVLIADSCSTVVSALYGLEQPTVLGRWAAALFFTLQLYFDFSGYSDMAVGLGKMFGFEFRENFDHPLAARSATDFWRRWHISLGSFFRDYVYIPLGGNRRAQLRNILIVWLLTGLWHGASWNFVLWGLYYAVLLILEKTFLLKLFDLLPKAVSFVVSHVWTLFITVFGFAIFYSDGGFPTLLRDISLLFGGGAEGCLSDIFTESLIVNNVFLLAAAAILSTPLAAKLLSSLSARIGSYALTRIVKTVLLTVLIAVCTVRLVGNTYSPFLYFRF